MLKKIAKIKNFGIYKDFDWNNLPCLKKYNLIYGWNRSGKTTISRIFSSCEKKSRFNNENFREYPENGEFELLMNSGETIKSNNIENTNIPTRVFNQDFIEDNISFKPTQYSNGIIYVSEKDIKSKKILDELNQKKKKLEIDYNIVQKDKSLKEKLKNTFLTSLGREIANTIFEKSYNKTNVENYIEKIGIENLKHFKISDEEKKEHLEISRRDIGSKMSLFSEIKPLFNEVLMITNYIKSLLNKKIISETLDRLKGDEDLNNWVKLGFDLHKEKNEYSTCLFCNEPITKNLFSSLSKHFSKNYIDLQYDIECQYETIKNFLYKEVNTSNTTLYPELSSEYISTINSLNSIIKENNNYFLGCENLLNEKHKNPFDEDLIDMFEEPKDFVNLVNKNIVDLNIIVNKHNDKINNHTDEIKKSKEKVELHIISSAVIDQNFMQMVLDYIKAEISEANIIKSLDNIKERINEEEIKSSDIVDAIQKINNLLDSFFGKNEITLDLDSTKKGYIIKRNNIFAHNLSEGEKTAIAFSYFIVKVEEKDFIKKNGIIFIDDPISSLDSNYIYHCFSLIKEHFNDVGQLYISTHNFHLFNLVKEWFTGKNKKIDKKNIKLKEKSVELKEYPCEFFMLENYILKNSRNARIILLDKTLKNYKSEYQFLFSRLYKFVSTNSEFTDLYTIGNIARRYFEIYADFKIPNSSNQRQKIEELVRIANGEKPVITSVESDKAYKLINEYSHNYNPLSSIWHTDKNECIDAVNILLKIVKHSDSKHFRILEHNCI